MAEAYLTLSGCAAAAVSVWTGYEAGYGQVRYTTPTVDGQAVTVTVPAVLRGASFSGAHLSYTLAQDAGTAAVRFEGTGLAATDAAILEKLQRGETELRLYFSFRASGGSGGEGAHSAYAAWSDIRVKVGYLPPDGAQGTLPLPDGRQVEYSVHAHSLAPGESAGVTLRLAGGGARAFRLDMAGEGESAYDSFAAVPEDGMLAQTQMSVSQAQWTGRLAPARLRVTVTDENGEHTSAWQQSALTLCAYYLAPAPACAWTDESGVQTDFGAFVQGKSRMKISVDAGLDTAADAGVTAVTRRLVLAGEEYLLGGDEMEIGLLQARVAELRKTGIKVALDDMGTGYSTVDLLLHMPADEIKLDMFFTREIQGDEKHELLTRALCTMTAKRNVDVCFEGVETQEMRDYLKGYGNVLLQGYFFDRPLLEEEFESKYCKNPDA